MSRTGLVIGGIWLGSMTWLHTIDRSDFLSLWTAYSLSFAMYVWLVFREHTLSLSFGLGLALCARLISFLFEPALSDDFYRFIWDGMLLVEGIHPMAYTPDDLMQHPEIFSPDPHLYSLLNHTTYHSVYPPVAQWIYGTSYALNHLHIGGHILFLKGVALLTDGLVIFLLYQLLQWQALHVHRILVYGLNPLIILEFTGNLHLDNLMIAGLLGAILLAVKRKSIGSGFFMAFSVLSKLVSLMLLPFMPRVLSGRHMAVFLGITLATTCAVCILFFKDNMSWLKSIGLWFHTFEFNASVYYLARELAYDIWGYNKIAIIGPVMTGLTLACLVILWRYYRKSRTLSWASAMVLALTIYYLMSTTIHPWYLAMPLTLSVFSGHRYPFVWTYVAFLSYSHYQNGDFRENYSLIACEYLILFAWMGWEFIEGRYSKEKPV